MLVLYVMNMKWSIDFLANFSTIYSTYMDTSTSTSYRAFQTDLLKLFVFGLSFFFLSMPVAVHAATTTWTFSDQGDFAFEDTLIEVQDDKAALIEFDQTDDDNSATGFGGGTHTGTKFQSGALMIGRTSQVAHWGFDELTWTGAAGEVLDNSGNANNGTTEGGLTTDTDAQFGRAGDFDGSDDAITFSASPVYSGTGALQDFSFSTWYKATDGDSFDVIAHGGLASVGGWSVYLMNGTTVVFETLETGVGSRVISKSSVALNQFHHIAGSYDADLGVLSLYVNGSKISTSATSTAQLEQTTDNAFTVGKRDMSGFDSFYFEGVIDEMVLYSRVLTDAEVTALATTAAPVQSGVFESRIFDGGVTTTWTTLVPDPQAPYGKPLPGDNTDESGYDINNANMSDNVLLLHMDEASWTGAAGDVVDSSGNLNHGTSQSGPLTIGGGIFDRAGSFDGVDDRLQFNNFEETAGATTMTLEGWFNFDSIDPNETLISQWLHGVNQRFSWQRFVAHDELVFYLPLTINTPTAFERWYTTGLDLQTNTWYHLALVWDSSEADLNNRVRIYKNGVEVTTVHEFTHAAVPLTGITSLTTSTGSNLVVGDLDGGFANREFDGRMDELAIFDRALLGAEILEHYERALTEIQYRVRSCDDAACDGEDFVGPDGTSDTFYSEADNAESTSAEFSLSVGNAQYFQYNALMQTDLISQIPKLNSVSVLPNHYTTLGPTIQPVPTSTAPLMAQIESFSATHSPDNRVFYQITHQADSDSPRWYHYDGAVWSLAVSSTAYNTAAEVNTHVGQFPTDVGDGLFGFRAFLTSPDATDATEISEVQVVANNAPTAPTSPVFGNAGLQFDGTDDIATISANSDLVMGTSDFSVGMWLNTTDATGVDLGIFSNGLYGADRALGTGLTYESSKVFFEVCGTVLQSPTNVANGNWHSVVGVRDDNTLQMYVDGNLWDEQTVALANCSYSGDVYIGAREPGVDVFEGDLDDLFLFKRALSASEIAAYHSDKAESWGDDESNFVANWKMTEGNGTALADAAGTHTATLNGPTWTRGSRTDTTDVPFVTPAFSTEFQDEAGDIANKARVQVSTDPTFGAITHWDSGVAGTTIADTAVGVANTPIFYGQFGTAPLQSLSIDDGGITYYWRMSFFDANGLQGVFSDAASFTLYDAPGVDTTPVDPPTPTTPSSGGGGGTHTIRKSTQPDLAETMYINGATFSTSTKRAVEISFSGLSEDVTEIAVHYDDTFAGVVWEPFNYDTFIYTLPEEAATYTLYAKLRSAKTSNISSVFSAVVVLMEQEDPVALLPDAIGGFPMDTDLDATTPTATPDTEPKPAPTLPILDIGSSVLVEDGLDTEDSVDELVSEEQEASAAPSIVQVEPFTETESSVALAKEEVGIVSKVYRWIGSKVRTFFSSRIPSAELVNITPKTDLALYNGATVLKKILFEQYVGFVSPLMEIVRQSL